MHEQFETMALKYLQWSQQVCSVDVLRNIVCEDVIRNFVQSWDESKNLTSPLELLLDTLPSMSPRVIEAVIWDSHIHGCIVNDLSCGFVSMHCCIVPSSCSTY
jgi:hypothetical protein